jgi:EPS-associated MarR family transcriptional regulator
VGKPTLTNNYHIPPDESDLKALSLLESNPHMSQRDLAEKLNVSLGKTNYCIRALLNKGFIKMQNFRNSQNKLAYAYLLTPAGILAKAELTARFLKLKMAEYEALRLEIEQLKVASDKKTYQDTSNT